LLSWYIFTILTFEALLVVYTIFDDAVIPNYRSIPLDFC